MEETFMFNHLMTWYKQYNEIRIRQIATDQGDDYTTGCLLDYQYFKDHYNLIAIDLSKQKEFDADLRAIQHFWVLWDAKN